MDRAKSLVSARTGLAALAIVPLAASASQAAIVLNLTNPTVQAPPFGYGGSNFFYPSNQFSFTGTPITNGVHITGSFSANGTNYQNTGTNFISLQGTSNGQVNVGDVMTTNYDFSVTYTGGTVYMSYINSFADPSLNAYQGFGQFVTSGQLISGSTVSNPSSSSQLLINNNWEVDLGFNWQGYAPGDTFSINIPSNSIDVTISSVPEPATATILILPAMALLRRRRMAS
jgi:hypothetical protein